MDTGKSGCFEFVCARFRALRGAPGVAVGVTDTFHVRCYYGKDSNYALTAWTQEKVVVLGVSVLVLGLQGAAPGVTDG